MISHAFKEYLLFVEPRKPAVMAPLNDQLTRRMAAALRQAKALPPDYFGVHTCICGVDSMPFDYLLPDGRRTNSLCVHYLAYHRAEIPAAQLRQVEMLACGEMEPGAEDLCSDFILHWSELDSAQQARVHAQTEEFNANRIAVLAAQIEKTADSSEKAFGLLSRLRAWWRRQAAK